MDPVPERPIDDDDGLSRWKDLPLPKAALRIESCILSGDEVSCDLSLNISREISLTIVAHFVKSTLMLM